MTIPTIDLRPWFAEDPVARAEIAQVVDRALQSAGFLLVTGHGVDDALQRRIRSAAREFFGLSAAVKERYSVRVGERGWLGPGAEANAYADGIETPPDLKESLSFAADEPTGDPAVDAEWFLPNTWPGEVPALRAAVEEYLAQMRALSDRLLELLGAALGEPESFFTRHTGHSTWGFNINWYPSRQKLGAPQPGQFRIGPHTDFGTVTVLDREAGRGGLQVFTDDGGWQDAPYDPAAFTVNIGDLMARWTGDRWRPGRHRVLPPPADEPSEELMSLVYFYECDPGTRVTSLPAPKGQIAYEPVDSHTYLRGKLDAISVPRAGSWTPPGIGDRE
ncbi:2-oxoglutarate and iron-dependent oxygenase domain-containing protein [Streptomyces sp. NPDC006446]|uniref:isopenicillin N synthase family dioxygenase n=1 Tax=Streptomyces sp. NPDC006446 TaxID=3154301 RepID=UPI0033B56A4A